MCPYTELVPPLSNLLDPTSSLPSHLLSLEWRGSVLWTGIVEAQTHMKTNKPFLSAILPLNSPSAFKIHCEYRHMFFKRHSFVLLIAMQLESYLAHTGTSVLIWHYPILLLAALGLLPVGDSPRCLTAPGNISHAYSGNKSGRMLTPCAVHPAAMWLCDVGSLSDSTTVSSDGVWHYRDRCMVCIMKTSMTFPIDSASITGFYLSYASKWGPMSIPH